MESLSFISPYEPQRLRAWPEIVAFFGRLPAPLREMGWGFAQRLARETSPTGEFRCALTDPNVIRVTHLSLWHIAACQGRGIVLPDAEALQAGLFVASFLGFCAIRIQDDFVDEDRPDTPRDHLLLSDLFSIGAIRRLQALFPSDSPLWEHHDRHWREFTEAVARDRQRNRGGLAGFDEEALQKIGHKAALLKTFPIAVALYAGIPEEVPRIEVMMDAFNTGVQLKNDLQSVRRDIESGHHTPPIAHAALEAGFGLGERPSRECLTGSLMLGTSVAETHALARAFLRRAKEISGELGITHLTDHLSWHEESLKEMEAPWRSLHLKAPPFKPRLRVTARSREKDEGPNSSVLERALDFLTADPEMREAWEVQRTGVWGHRALVGDLFSRSLILDALAEMGWDVKRQIEALLERYRGNGWRYYQGFRALPPDIDDVAQAIHLLRHTAWEEGKNLEYLKTPLRWLAANRAPDGGFPVWLTEGVEDRPEEGWISLGGLRCAACEANLLTALAPHDLADERSWGVAGVRSLLGRWEAHGDDAVYFYRGAYAAFLVARCFARLRSLSWMPPEVSARLDDALKGIVERAAASIRYGVGDSLTLAASLMALRCARDPSRDVIERAQRLLNQRQSFDGGWEASDFFRCPGTSHQAIGWHGSRLLTTAVVGLSCREAEPGV